MDRSLAALVLDEIGELLALQGADPFRVRAYRTAARAVEGTEGDLADALARGELEEVAGLGPATIGVVRELVETGRSAFYDRLRESTPAGVVQLRSVSGLGPKRVRTLHERLGIETLAELKVAAESGRIAELPGFGPATQKRILEGIAFVAAGTGRRRQPQAYATAHRLIDFLEGRGADSVRLAGELRRGCETVSGIGLLSVAGSPGRVLDAFVAVPSLTGARRVSDDVAEATLSDGAPVRVRCVPPEAAAAAWIHETGSDAHWTALVERAAAPGGPDLRLDPDGLWSGEERVDTPDEAALYAELGLEWIPPELREGRGEVEAAAEGRLPRLVEYGDLRGTFHCHTTWSDGTASVAEMAGAALARGWRYLGIADHSQNAGYAGGLSPDRVRAQHGEIDAWNRERGRELRLFKGTEADILPDGDLDYDDGLLATFDYVVGSVHSGFRMGRDAMTERIRRAVGHPSLTMLGHATGRLLLTRDGYDVDLGAVLEAAGEAGAAVEINGDPRRMELDWRHWPRARSLGIRCSINPDAHSTAGLGSVVHGVSVARKGWLEAEDVINTWELERVERYLGGE